MEKAPATPPQRLAYSVADMCAATGLSRSHINREIVSGRLASFRSGKRRLIAVEQAKTYIQQLTEATNVAK